MLYAYIWNWKLKNTDPEQSVEKQNANFYALAQLNIDFAVYKILNLLDLANRSTVLIASKLSKDITKESVWNSLDAGVTENLAIQNHIRNSIIYLTDYFIQKHPNTSGEGQSFSFAGLSQSFNNAFAKNELPVEVIAELEKTGLFHSLVLKRTRRSSSFIPLQTAEQNTSHSLTTKEFKQYIKDEIHSLLQKQANDNLVQDWYGTDISAWILNFVTRIQKLPNWANGLTDAQKLAISKVAGIKFLAEQNRIDIDEIVPKINKYWVDTANNILHLRYGAHYAFQFDLAKTQLNFLNNKVLVADSPLNVPMGAVNIKILKQELAKIGSQGKKYLSYDKGKLEIKDDNNVLTAQWDQIKQEWVFPFPIKIIDATESSNPITKRQLDSKISHLPHSQSQYFVLQNPNLKIEFDGKRYLQFNKSTNTTEAFFNFHVPNLFRNGLGQIVDDPSTAINLFDLTKSQIENNEYVQHEIENHNNFKVFFNAHLKNVGNNFAPITQNGIELSYSNLTKTLNLKRKIIRDNIYDEKKVTFELEIFFLRSLVNRQLNTVIDSYNSVSVNGNSLNQYDGENTGSQKSVYRKDHKFLVYENWNFGWQNNFKFTFEVYPEGMIRMWQNFRVLIKGSLIKDNQVQRYIIWRKGFFPYQNHILDSSIFKLYLGDLVSNNNYPQHINLRVLESTHH